MTTLTYQTGDSQESRNGAFTDGAAARFQERGVQAIQENRHRACDNRWRSEPSRRVRRTPADATSQGQVRAHVG
jgi:hypothetical protein